MPQTVTTALALVASMRRSGISETTEMTSKTVSHG
jgi:hypothetical protein